MRILMSPLNEVPGHNILGLFKIFFCLFSGDFSPGKRRKNYGLCVGDTV